MRYVCVQGFVVTEEIPQTMVILSDIETTKLIIVFTLADGPGGYEEQMFKRMQLKAK